jgi:branched-chain amino acid transport system permease protein
LSEFLQFFFLGLGRGAIYATLAIAVVIIFRATGLLNFAQGQMAMFSTFIVWGFYDGFGLPLWPSVLLGMVVSFLMGALIERLLIRPVSDKAGHNPLPVVIVTIGLFLGFQALAPWLWGETAKPFPQLFGSGSVEIFGASIDYQTLGTLAMLAAEVLVLYLLFQRTKVGLAMRGVASNSESAALVGVPVGNMLMIGWGLSAAFGVLAGVATADVGLDSTLMLGPLIYAFAAATLGGFDSPLGAVVGGLIVGVVTELLAHYVDAIGNDLKLLPAFLLILVVLLVRPQGLFGKAQVTRV